jgi:uncharacterized protein (TIGR00369 family)
MSSIPSAVPGGFRPHARRSPVTDPWQPIHAREAGDSLELGLVIHEGHCNARGFLHGGVIAALADNAMGLSLGLALKGAHLAGDVSGIVTTGLSVDYLASGRIGQWLHVEPRVLKAGRRSGTVDALVRADSVLIARASASFAVLSGEGPA